MAVSTFSGVGVQGGSQLRERRTGGSHWRISGEPTDFRELPGKCCPPDFGAGRSRENYKGISRKLVAISAFSGVRTQVRSQLRARRTGGTNWGPSGGLTDFRKLLGTYCLADFGTGRIRKGCKESSGKFVDFSTFSGVGS